MSDSDTKKEKEPFIKVDDRIDASLIENRRIFLSNQVDSKTAHDIIRKLWYLELQDPGKPILFIINSPGGSVDDGFAIWDQTKMISSPITTLVTGLAASMGSILSLCGEKGRKFATPNARFMIHQPLIGGVIQGQATDLDIQAQEILKTRKRITQTYVDETGKSFDQVDEAIDRDTWMTSPEAKNFGLINKIVTSFKDLK